MKPLRVLARRRRESAAREPKAAAYESALQSARLQIYREHEEHRMRRQAEQAVALQSAPRSGPGTD